MRLSPSPDTSETWAFRLDPSLPITSTSGDHWVDKISLPRQETVLSRNILVPSSSLLSSSCSLLPAFIFPFPAPSFLPPAFPLPPGFPWQVAVALRSLALPGSRSYTVLSAPGHYLAELWSAGCSSQARTLPSHCTQSILQILGLLGEYRMFKGHARSLPGKQDNTF